MFWLKKAVSYWLMPVPLSLALLVLGICLACSAKYARLGRRLLVAVILLLLVLSNKTISVWLVRPLETTYPAIPELALDRPLPPGLAACRYVVILGSGHTNTAELSATNQLCSSAQARLLEALRLLRHLPDATLITSGPGQPGQPTHAAVLARAAVSLGADATRIVTLDTPRDTEDESVEIKRVVGDQPFALVTSAWHLPRAMVLMRKARLNALPCPADYSARRPAPTDWYDFLWDVESLDRSTFAIHEGLGLLWYRLRGKF